MKNFWDFCAPFYDLASKANGRAYGDMLRLVREIVPQGATVMDVAAGTGAVSLALAGQASRVLCTDTSENMLRIASRKVVRAGVQNVTIEKQDIFALSVPDHLFDVVIAGQILHLIDEPEKAAAELRRVAKSMVILPMSFTKNLRGIAKLRFDLYRIFGFAPKIELSADDYEAFLQSIGFADCAVIPIAGRLPMAVAVWHATPRFPSPLR